MRKPIWNLFLEFFINYCTWSTMACNAATASQFTTAFVTHLQSNYYPVNNTLYS